MISLIIIGILALSLGLGLGLGLPKTAPFLVQSMKIENLMAHLENLEGIAKLHSNSRAIEYGYNASVDYVLNQLATTNLKVSVQYFDVVLSEIASPASLVLQQPVNIDYVDGKDFLLDLGFQGNFSVSANVSAGFFCYIYFFSNDWEKRSIWDATSRNTPTRKQEILYS